MPDEPINGREPDKSEDDIQREKLGPGAAPGKESPTKMTLEREKKTPGVAIPGTLRRRDVQVKRSPTRAEPSSRIRVEAYNF
jgi:hypothetical protein